VIVSQRSNNQCRAIKRDLAVYLFIYVERSRNRFVVSSMHAKRPSVPRQMADHRLQFTLHHGCHCPESRGPVLPLAEIDSSYMANAKACPQIPAREIQMAPQTPMSGSGAAGAGDSEPRVRAAQQGVFHQVGDYWTIGRGGKSLRLRDAEGLRHLAHLLTTPRSNSTCSIWRVESQAARP
jgi:hypothetical protein